MTSRNNGLPESPFEPAVEGFQVILLAGAAEPQAASGILAALDADGRPDSPASTSEDCD